MTGKFIDSIYYRSAKPPTRLPEGFFFLDTDYGKLRVFDTGGDQKQTLINVPDGPNVIEHQLDLIKKLSRNYRIICFEYPGLGFSFPNPSYDYSFGHGSLLLLQVMEVLKIEKASLLFSCSNGFYALNAASIDPDRFNHVFISQTPSVASMVSWTEKSIPNLLKFPVIGQLANILKDKELARLWYQYALPKESDKREPFRTRTNDMLRKRGCFCLSSLVQNLKKESGNQFQVQDMNVTLVWGGQDFTHRKTEKESIRDHVRSCEIIAFENCGHFPELEDANRYVSLVNERLN